MIDEQNQQTGIKEHCGPRILVGIIDKASEVDGTLNGPHSVGGVELFPGRFHAVISAGKIKLSEGNGRESTSDQEIALMAGTDSSICLSRVTIGNSFHWERKEDQTFKGNLILKRRGSNEIAVINDVYLEDYLESVISSEMSGNSPLEFLIAHAILSRSWLLAALKRKKDLSGKSYVPRSIEPEAEIVKWYEQEDHDLYDVCADDHCQRYQGTAKILSSRAVEAVQKTRGRVLMYGGEICDARFSKSCGGITEELSTAWESKHVPYLTSISDAPCRYQEIRTEEDAVQWIRSRPDAYCNTTDESVIQNILPGFDRETESWFRWQIEYRREELEDILREKSGIDFGNLLEINPLSRGPSGRICRLEIIGTKKRVVVGKELEIRRWLSRTHLYSSAFYVTREYDKYGGVRKFILRGAGWGHGVGLCQIGAAVMASRGHSAEAILSHYFPDAQICGVY